MNISVEKNGLFVLFAYRIMHSPQYILEDPDEYLLERVCADHGLDHVERQPRLHVDRLVQLQLSIPQFVPMEIFTMGGNMSSSTAAAGPARISRTLCTSTSSSSVDTSRRVRMGVGYTVDLGPAALDLVLLRQRPPQPMEQPIVRVRALHHSFYTRLSRTGIPPMNLKATASAMIS